MKQFLLLIFFLFPTFLFAQVEGPELADSLLHMLPSMKSDTNKAKVLIQLSNTFVYINQEKGSYYGNQAIALTEELGWKVGLAKANMALGSNYLSAYDNTKALNCFLKALSIYEKLGQRVSVAQALGNVANVYSNESNYPAALENNFKALKVFEELGDKKSQTIALANLGNIYRNQSNYPKALEYCFKSLKYAQELGMRSSIASSYSIIGNVYLDEKMYDTALVYDLKGIKIVEEMGDRVRLAVRYITIANVYLHMGQYEKALSYNLSSIKLSTEINDTGTLASAMGNIGDYYLYLAKDPAFGADKTSNLNKAVDYLQRALALNKLIDDIDEQQLTNQSLSEAQFLLGNYKDALLTYKEYIKDKDSIFSVAKNLKIADIETTRNLELKEKDIQIEQLKAKNKRNERTLYIAGIIVLLAIVAFVLRQLLNQRNSNKQLAREKRRHLLHIEAQHNVLKDIAHVQAHDIRGPVATLLGLSKLFNQSEPFDPYNAELMQDVIDVAERLDKIVIEIVNKENTVIINAPDNEAPEQP